MNLKNPTFSILVVTYNRHKMLVECLQSILEQTFDNYEVFVLDRGSEPSAETIVAGLNDDRFKYIRSSQEIHFVDGSNEIIKNINGKYFVNLADDDVWTKDTLSLVSSAFEKNEDCDIVQAGLVMYDYDKTSQPLEDKDISAFSNLSFADTKILFKKYDGKNMACHTFMDAGIGEYKEYDLCAYPQPTGIFIRKTAIDKVFDRQKGLFIKTFQDGGYHSISYRTQIFYLNVPLGIFAVNHSSRESNANRRRWKSEFENFEHTPLHNVATFWNCALDTLLKVIYRNNLDKEYKTYLRPDFFVKQLKEIMKDKPKDFITFRDAFLVAYYLILSCLAHPLFAGKYFVFDKIAKIIIKVITLIKEPSQFYKLVLEKPLNSIRKRLFKKSYLKKINEPKENQDIESKCFNSILEFKKYLEQRFESKVSSLQDELDKQCAVI